MAHSFWSMHLMVEIKQKILLQIYNSTLLVQGIVSLPLEFWVEASLEYMPIFSGIGVIPFPEMICPKY